MAKRWVHLIQLSMMLLVSAVVMLHLRAQDNGGQSQIQDFFANLAQHSSSSLPGESEIDQIESEIQKARPQDVSRALPSILAALKNPDEGIRFVAGRGLLAVANRGDSAPLLNEYIPSLGDLIFTPDTLAQKMAMATLATLKPSPPPAVVPPLVKLLKQTGEDRMLNVLQVAALGILVTHQPDNPEAIGALEQYMSRPLDSGKQLAVLERLQHSLEKDRRIVTKVTDMLDSSNKSVKVEAIKTLKAMGKEALLQAQPKLQQLAHAPDQPAEVKAEANKAIRESNQ